MIHSAASSSRRSPAPLLRLVLGAALFLALLPTGAAHAQDGVLDPSFGTGGKVVTDFSGGFDEGSSVAVLADGKILVAGTASNGPNYGSGLARYNADGTLDLSFSTDGKVITDFSTSGYDYGSEMEVLADGKILVAGSAYNGSNQDFALVRYNSDGTLDTSFDTDGKVTTDFGGGNDYGVSLVVQADGKIVVVGYTGAGNRNFALARYNADGVLDPSFGTGGKTTTDFGGGDDLAFSVVQQADGKIVVAGHGDNPSNRNFVLARYNADGTLDTSFDTDGKTTTDFGGDFDQGVSMVLQADGKILVGGNAKVGGNTNFALARYNADGVLDPSFGSGGKTTTDFAGNADYGHEIALLADGKILFTGYARNNSGSDAYFALARYNADGTLDPSFGSGGKTTTDFAGSTNDVAFSVAVQTDGAIVVAGRIQSGSNYNFALARYTGSSGPAGGSGGGPSGPCDTADWAVVLAAGDYPATTVGATHRDDGNTAGMAACATDGLDAELDAPEPGAPTGAYVQLYIDGPAADPVFGSRYTKQHVETQDLASAYYDFTLKVMASGYTGQMLALEASDLGDFPAGYDLVVRDGTGTNALAHDLRGGAFPFTYNGARTLTLRVGNYPAPDLTFNGPAAGGTLPVGTPYPVTWTTTETSEVLIEVSTDGGATWTTIAVITDPTQISEGTYSWTPGAAHLGQNVTLRVTSTNAVGETDPVTSPAFKVAYPAPVASITGLETSGDAAFDDLTAYPAEAATVRVQARYTAGATLAFSKDGGTTFTDITTWTNPTPSDLTANVQADLAWTPALGDVTYDGLLRLTASNGEGLTTVVTSVRTNVLPRSAPFSLGAGFQMASLPMEAGTQTASQVFVDGTSGVGVSPLFLYSYAPASFYTLFDNAATTFTTGAGFWAGAGAAGAGTFSGTLVEAGTSLPLGAAGSYMLGVPYLLSITTEEISFTLGAETKPYGEALTAGWIAAGLYTWNAASGYVDASAGALSPWASYWLPAGQAGLTVGFAPPTAASAAASKTGGAAALPQWALVVQAESAGGQKDLTTALGLHADALMAYDRYDVPEPPAAPVPGPVRAYAERSAWGAAFSEYDREVQPPFAAGEERPWTFVVEAPPGAVTLSFQMGAEANGSLDAPLVADLAFELVDEVAAVRRPIAPGARYGFESDGQARTLKVVVRASSTSTAVEDEAEVPQAYVLEAAYPNPFNPQATIGFSLPQSSKVRLAVYDVLGREVAVLVEGTRPAGRHTATLQASHLPSGTYVYRLEAGAFSQTRRMVLVK